MEAIINIVVSIILVKSLGLIGVAIGTVVSAFYRYAATVTYLRKHVLYRSISVTIIKQLVYFIPGFCSCALGYRIALMDLSIGRWFMCAIVLFVISTIIHLIIDLIFFRPQLNIMLKRM